MIKQGKYVSRCVYETMGKLNKGKKKCRKGKEVQTTYRVANDKNTS